MSSSECDTIIKASFGIRRNFQMWFDNDKEPKITPRGIERYITQKEKNVLSCNRAYMVRRFNLDICPPLSCQKNVMKYRVLN